MSKEGIYIIRLSVSNDSFTKHIYGCHANDKPFHGMGIATFLLQLVQIQASSNGWNVDLF